MNNLKIQGDADSVGPLPNVPNYMPYSGTYNPLEYIPMPFYTASENTVYGYNREESVLSGSGEFYLCGRIDSFLIMIVKGLPLYLLQVRGPL